MDGLDKITSKIEQDAADCAAVITEKANADFSKIISSSEEEAKQLYWNRSQENLKKMQNRSLRLQATAESQAKKTILSFKQETVEDVFAKAKDTLLNLPRNEYIDFFADKVLKAVVTGKEILIFNDKDRESVSAEITEKVNRALDEKGMTSAISVSEESASFSGGVIVCNGNVLTNCTVDSMIAEAKEALSSEIANFLFA